MKLKYWLAASVLAAATNSFAAAPACDRACLTGIVDNWFNALIANDARKVATAADARITMNGKPMAMGKTFWDGASEVIYRWDIVNTRLGDTGTEAVVLNADGSKTMIALRLKVADGRVTETEIIKANKGDAGALWNPDNLTAVSPALQLTIRESERDSYYGLIAAAEGYWRAFQTNGTPEYHPANLLPDTQRFENGVQTTGLVRDGQYRSTAAGFDNGNFVGRNLWDRRYPVVDEERGIVMSIVRFGLKTGMQSQSSATSNDRLVAEFFTVKHGWLQEIHAVLFNMDDAEPTGWSPEYGPGRGGW
ncbi:MAG: hypothetical protein H6978_13475 [Gammaproteobacteria bacterium]|nr:hypothetical protein [Gammaproteobacteria bacterium]